MCGIGAMASILKAKVKGKRRASGKSSAESSPTRSGTNSPNGRVIPPEPVQLLAHGGDMTENDAEPALQVHNLARAAKSCKALDWNDHLAKDAQAHAEHLARLGRLEYSGTEKQGENIFMSDGGDASFEDAVQIWLNGEKEYHGEHIGQGNFEDWRHFCEFRMLPSDVLCSV